MVGKIYTLGTSNRCLEEFLEIFKNYQMLNVIDVRCWPTSKWFQRFKKENLEKILAENGIEYFHLERQVATELAVLRRKTPLEMSPGLY